VPRSRLLESVSWYLNLVTGEIAAERGEDSR